RRHPWLSIETICQRVYERPHFLSELQQFSIAHLFQSKTKCIEINRNAERYARLLYPSWFGCTAVFHCMAPVEWNNHMLLPHAKLSQSAARTQRLAPTFAGRFLPHTEAVRRIDRSDTPSSRATSRQERPAALRDATLRESTVT